MCTLELEKGWDDGMGIAVEFLVARAVLVYVIAVYGNLIIFSLIKIKNN
jgi:hypothetical protein